jgi:hypothetical protein
LGVFFRLLKARKHQKKFLAIKGIKKNLDEKVKCQPWIIKIRMRKPNWMRIVLK